MRITTWNVNGLRAAIRKGFEKHIDLVAPDILLLQEIRVQPEQLPDEWSEPDGWHVHWNPAQKKGYAGTAVWTREPSTLVRTGLTDTDKDEEGRVCHVRVGDTEVASVYLPSGSSGPERQEHKEAWMRRFKPWATKQLATQSMFVFGGDLNIAHTENDIFYVSGNRKNSGFLPHEREWFGRLLHSGWHDVVREQEGDVKGPYSWWSNRGKARELDRGWRIDYLLANGAANENVQRTTIHREGGLEVSDHAPVSVDL
jgi:exodeoxyribonuclease-3